MIRPITPVKHLLDRSALELHQIAGKSLKVSFWAWFCWETGFSLRLPLFDSFFEVGTRSATSDRPFLLVFDHSIIQKLLVWIQLKRCLLFFFRMGKCWLAVWSEAFSGQKVTEPVVEGNRVETINLSEQFKTMPNIFLILSVPSDICKGMFLPETTQNSQFRVSNQPKPTFWTETVLERNMKIPSLNSKWAKQFELQGRLQSIGKKLTTLMRIFSSSDSCVSGM